MSQKSDPSAVSRRGVEQILATADNTTLVIKATKNGKLGLCVRCFEGETIAKTRAPRTTCASPLQLLKSVLSCRIPPPRLRGGVSNKFWPHATTPRWSFAPAETARKLHTALTSRATVSTALSISVATWPPIELVRTCLKPLVVENGGLAFDEGIAHHVRWGIEQFCQLG
jgi:hypothetical protein